MAAVPLIFIIDTISIPRDTIQLRIEFYTRYLKENAAFSFLSSCNLVCSLVTHYGWLSPRRFGYLSPNNWVVGIQRCSKVTLWLRRNMYQDQIALLMNYEFNSWWQSKIHSPHHAHLQIFFECQYYSNDNTSGGSRISQRGVHQPRRGGGCAPTHYLTNFPKNCMKMKKFSRPLQSILHTTSQIGEADFHNVKGISDDFIINSMWCWQLVIW